MLLKSIRIYINKILLKPANWTNSADSKPFSYALEMKVMLNMACKLNI